MLNTITIQGRLTKDPELRTTQTGVSVTTFTLACDRDFDREKVDFFNCVAWRQTGEFVSKYFRKGQLMVVNGSLQNRDWTDKNGNKRTSSEIICDNVYFCEGKKQTADVSAVDFVELPDDGEELPF